MKKTVIVLLFFLFLFLLCSCGKEDLIDRDLFLTLSHSKGYEDSLYPTGACTGEKIRYVSAHAVDPTYDDAYYHYVCCFERTCDFADHMEAHSVNKETLLVTKYCFAVDNGIRYHYLEYDCPACGRHFGNFNKMNDIKGRLVKCRTQAEGCDGSCLDDWEGWEELLCVTP